MTLTELSRRERKKEETRRRIFEAAVELFRSKGFDATTVEEITEKADVGRGTFFNYFPRKESVLAWLSEEKLLVAEEHGAALLAEDRPSREKLIELFAFEASAYEADKDMSRYVFSEKMKLAFVPTREVEMRWQTLIMELISRGQAQGELRTDVSAERAEGLLTSVYIVTLYHWLFCPEDCGRQAVDLQPELHARLSIVLDGLAQRGGR